MFRAPGPTSLSSMTGSGERSQKCGILHELPECQRGILAGCMVQDRHANARSYSSTAMMMLHACLTNEVGIEQRAEQLLTLGKRPEDF